MQLKIQGASIVSVDCKDRVVVAASVMIGRAG